MRLIDWANRNRTVTVIIAVALAVLVWILSRTIWITPSPWGLDQVCLEGGKEVSRAQVASKQLCRAACENKSNCGYWTYETSGTCILWRDERGQDVPSTRACVAEKCVASGCTTGCGSAPTAGIGLCAGQP